jgi:hypothetical protein
MLGHIHHSRFWLTSFLYNFNFKLSHVPTLIFSTPLTCSSLAIVSPHCSALIWVIAKTYMQTVFVFFSWDVGTTLHIWTYLLVFSRAILRGTLKFLNWRCWICHIHQLTIEHSMLLQRVVLGSWNCHSNIVMRSDTREWSVCYEIANNSERSIWNIVLE